MSPLLGPGVPFTPAMLLYTRMAPLRPSADFPYVGAQKDTYGLRFA